MKTTSPLKQTSRMLQRVLVGVATAALGTHRCLANEAISSWTMRDGTALTLVREDAGFVLKDSHENRLLDFPDPLVVERTAVSSERTCILMRVVSKRVEPGKKIRSATWYSHLALVYKSDSGKWKARRVLSGNEPPMNELYRSVEEVGAVSNSGLKAVLLINEWDSKEIPPKMVNVWRTMRLDNGEVLAEGRELPKTFEEGGEASMVRPKGQAFSK
jgi:hypothetical protein